MFTGSFVATVTPFKDGKIDERALKNLIERQIQNGSHGIVPCGTTGESATLTHEEHERVIEITVQQVAGRVRVLAGAGSNATHEAIRLQKAAEKKGADGTLHISPYYNKPTQEGVYCHYRAISEASSIPMIIYNVPSRTALNVLPETVARCAELKNIIGIKEACGNLEQIAKVISFCSKNFIVLSGEDSQTLDMLKMGARGAISVTANILPRQCADEWDFFSKGNLDRATQIHENLMPLHRALFYETNPIPVKAALSMMNLIEEEYRLPLVKMSSENRERLKTELTSLGLIK